jgi:hypothetical protein
MSAVGQRIYFSEWLQAEMDKRGWSQSDLARSADLNRAVINKLLNGKSHPQPPTLGAISRVPSKFLSKLHTALPVCCPAARTMMTRSKKRSMSSKVSAVLSVRQRQLHCSKLSSMKRKTSSILKKESAKSPLISGGFNPIPCKAGISKCIRNVNTFVNKNRGESTMRE